MTTLEIATTLIAHQSALQNLVTQNAHDQVCLLNPYRCSADITARIKIREDCILAVEKINGDYNDRVAISDSQAAIVLENFN